MKSRTRAAIFVVAVIPFGTMLLTSVTQADITISQKLLTAAFIWMIVSIIGFLVLWPDVLEGGVKDSEAAT